jgi:hypothetical protein
MNVERTLPLPDEAITNIDPQVVLRELIKQSPCMMATMCLK